MTYEDLSGLSAYVAVDLETTGLKAEKGDTIIEVAALKYVNNVITNIPTPIIANNQNWVAPAIINNTSINKNEITIITSSLLLYSNIKILVHHLNQL